MKIIQEIADKHADMKAWRHELHQHPETAFEEHKTADFVEKKLQSFGIKTHRGLAGTGVVGVLKNGTGDRSIGLRADMDALDILEKTNLEYQSTHQGKMHACGHDGHTTMLLGAAHYLSQHQIFDGTVYFIFQPAEENEGGARVMIEQGLFDQFDCDEVYGMHNIPGIPTGQFAVKEGPIMAANDMFEIMITGIGPHAALPHNGIDPIVIASQLAMGLQTIASRNTNALKSAVVTITQIHAGEAWNVIPDTIVLRGTTRSFDSEVQDMIENNMKRLVEHTAKAFGAEGEMKYERRYPATVNAKEQTQKAIATMGNLVGEANVDLNILGTMGAEDFAFMLQKRPGCYVWIGNGNSSGVHNPHYDFNDEILPLGTSYWVRLVEEHLL